MKKYISENDLIMKRVVLLILSITTLLCELTIAHASIQTPPDGIPLTGETPPGGGPHSPAIIPIACYLFSSLNSVSIQSTSITTPSLVIVENTTTGASTQEYILINSIPSSISLLGPGQYTITITLSSGTQYYGSFSY